MRTNPPTRFEPTISRRLRLICTEDDLRQLRLIVDDAQRGRRPWRPWYWPFMADIFKTLKEHTMPNPKDNSEVFRLSEDCEGVIWREPDGWHGCLRWSLLGDTNFIVPLNTRQEAIDSVKSEYFTLERIADE